MLNLIKNDTTTLIKTLLIITLLITLIDETLLINDFTYNINI